MQEKVNCRDLNAEMTFQRVQSRIKKSVRTWTSGWEWRSRIPHRTGLPSPAARCRLSHVDIELIFLESDCDLTMGVFRTLLLITCARSIRREIVNYYRPNSELIKTCISPFLRKALHNEHHTTKREEEGQQRRPPTHPTQPNSAAGRPFLP